MNHSVHRVFDFPCFLLQEHHSKTKEGTSFNILLKTLIPLILEGGFRTMPSQEPSKVRQRIVSVVPSFRGRSRRHDAVRLGLPEPPGDALRGWRDRGGDRRRILGLWQPGLAGLLREWRCSGGWV